MTADKRADILSLARKTIHTEALALKHLEQTLGDDFVCAVELILHSRGKLVVTGMGKSGRGFSWRSGNDLSGRYRAGAFLFGRNG